MDQSAKHSIKDLWSDCGKVPPLSAALAVIGSINMGHRLSRPMNTKHSQVEWGKANICRRHVQTIRNSNCRYECVQSSSRHPLVMRYPAKWSVDICQLKERGWWWCAPFASPRLFWCFIQETPDVVIAYTPFVSWVLR